MIRPTSGVPRWSYDFKAKRRTNPFKKPGTKAVLRYGYTIGKDRSYPAISHVGEAIDRFSLLNYQQIQERPTLKMRDPYPNTTNGETAIVPVLFRVTITTAGSTPSRYISTPLLDVDVILHALQNLR